MRVGRFSRFALSSMDMEQRDYDSRTALHVAAAEGTQRRRSLSGGGSVTLTTGMITCVCVFQGMERWFASCWRGAKSTQFPRTGK